MKGIWLEQQWNSSRCGRSWCNTACPTPLQHYTLQTSIYKTPKQKEQKYHKSFQHKCRTY